MAKLTTLQPFRDIGEIKNIYHITLAKPYEWRLIKEPFVGEINGISKMRGVAVATNGILVAIMQPTGMCVGHLDYFVADVDKPDAFTVESAVAKQREHDKATYNVPKVFEQF